MTSPTVKIQQYDPRCVKFDQPECNEIRGKINDGGFNYSLLSLVSIEC